MFEAVGDFIDAQQVLEADWQREAAEVRALEQGITLPEPGEFNNDAVLLRQWVQARRASETDLPGTHVVRLLRTLTPILILLAVILGSGLTKLVFYYDGSAPVNIINVLAILVVLPLLLLIPGLFAMGPGRSQTRQRSIARYSPGSLLIPALRSLPEKHSEKLERVFGIGLHGSALYQDTALWLVLYLGQLFSCWFYGAVCCTVLYLVAFSDLAFAWSTTLEISEYSVHQLTSILSAPWKYLFPNAVPSLELIESSRFYRLQPGLLAREQIGLEVSRLGEWWPFLLCGIFVYSFLPRVILLFYTRFRLSRTLTRSLLTLPGSQETLARLKGEWIPLGSEKRTTVSEEESPQLGLQAESALPLSDCYLISWGDLKQEALHDRLTAVGLTVVKQQSAGGNVELEDEEKIIEELSAIPDNTSVIIAAKRWEPPGGELLDFLRAARAKLSNTRAIYIAPLSENIIDGTNAVLNDNAQLLVWRKVTATLGDPWLRIIDLENPEAE